MFWKLGRKEYEQKKGEGNRRAFRGVVRSGEIPGLLAYAEGRPVAWCAVAPREAYPRLERSRVLGRVDDRPVWSVVCFFVDRKFRRQGVTVDLLKAATEYAKKRGAKIVEGYPTDPGRRISPDAFVYTGLVSAFRQAGFVEVERRSRTRLIMRCYPRGEQD